MSKGLVPFLPGSRLADLESSDRRDQWSHEGEPEASTDTRCQLPTFRREPFKTHPRRCAVIDYCPSAPRPVTG